MTVVTSCPASRRFVTLNTGTSSSRSQQYPCIVAVSASQTTGFLLLTVAMLLFDEVSPFRLSEVAEASVRAVAGAAGVWPPAAGGAADDGVDEDSSEVAVCRTNGKRFIVMDGCEGNIGEPGVSLAGETSGEVPGGEPRPESTAIVISR